MKIELIRLSPSAKIPKRAKEDDAGLDLFASENITIPAKNRKIVPTGIAIHLPKKTVGLVWDKSGIARENGLTTLGGVIDSGYQGEIQVIIYNSGSKPVTIKVKPPAKKPEDLKTGYSGGGSVPPEVLIAMFKETRGSEEDEEIPKVQGIKMPEV